MLRSSQLTRALARAGLRAMSSAAGGQVAFIGLGNMGAHMARNLVKDGQDVKVFDLSEEAVESVVSAGATAASSAADAATGASVVVTMLPSSPHVKSVYEGEIFPNVAEGTMLLDCSTIDPTVSQALAADAAEQGLRMLDAPVSGGVGGAEAGTLTFMVGGPEADFEESKAVLGPMGANIVHCGAAGTGQVAKICNNLVLGISMSAVSEAMALGTTLGADPKVLAGIINTSSGRCWSSDTYNPCPGVMEGVPSSRDYEGGFGAALMLKDLGLAADAAHKVGTPLPTGLAALTAYRQLTNNGYAKKDFSSMYKFLGGKTDA